jgi:hypothetical protein
MLEETLVRSLWGTVHRVNTQKEVVFSGYVDQVAQDGKENKRVSPAIFSTYPRGHE